MISKSIWHKNLLLSCNIENGR